MKQKSEDHQHTLLFRGMVKTATKICLKW